MHVHVDAARVDRKPQRERGLAVVVEHVAIRLAQRVRQHAVAHEPAVDEHVLAAALHGVGGPHREAGEAHVGGFGLHARGMRDEVVAERAARRAPWRPATGRRCTTRPLCCSVNRDRRMRERDAAERLLAMSPFRRFRAQELAARGRVEEELLDRDARAAGKRCGRRPATRCRPRPRCATRAACRRRATRARGATPTRSTRAPRRESRTTRWPRGRSATRILDVAWRATASGRSSRAMPAPLSTTRMRLTPPPRRRPRSASRPRRPRSPAAPSAPPPAARPLRRRRSG